MFGKAEGPEYPFGLCRDGPVLDDPVQNHRQEELGPSGGADEAVFLENPGDLVFKKKSVGASVPFQALLETEKQGSTKIKADDGGIIDQDISCRDTGEFCNEALPRVSVADKTVADDGIEFTIPEGETRRASDYEVTSARRQVWLDSITAFLVAAGNHHAISTLDQIWGQLPVPASNFEYRGPLGHRWQHVQGDVQLSAQKPLTRRTGEAAGIAV